MGLVYHYASPEATMSILQKRALWFSDCEFLNDPEEIAYCYRLYDEAWVEVCSEAGIPERQIDHALTSGVSPYECESPISEALGHSVAARYYSFSTCLDPDNLAMWSCYSCRNGRAGYALGFDVEALACGLRKLMCSHEDSGICFDVLSDEICYSKIEQRKRIECHIRDYLNDCCAIGESQLDSLDRVMAGEVSRSDHWARMSALAPFIKRPEFSYEHEYRFVLRLCHIPVDSVDGNQKNRQISAEGQWRLSPSGTPIPYYELSLGQLFSDALSEVLIMKPGDSHITLSGMKRLLDELGCRCASVEEASVQLRIS